ncbi:MAG TPA: NYN domain-containing protein, partial [Candidatus Lokiarchaeia archaeon]|nr:NYN domain-containing protein [Candidatus Lokiarchaeia archaeon]
MYLDTQNIYHHYPGSYTTAKRHVFEVKVSLIESVAGNYGPIALRHAFWPQDGKYSKAEDEWVHSTLESAGYTVRSGASRKDTDTTMAGVCMDDLHKKRFTRAVIVSGDADFAVLGRYLHQYRKPFIVIAGKGSIRDGSELQTYAEKTF